MAGYFLDIINVFSSSVLFASSKITKCESWETTRFPFPLYRITPSLPPPPSPSPPPLIIIPLRCIAINVICARWLSDNAISPVHAERIESGNLRRSKVLAVVWMSYALANRQVPVLSPARGSLVREYHVPRRHPCEFNVSVIRFRREWYLSAAYDTCSLRKPDIDTLVIAQRGIMRKFMIKSFNETQR